MFTLRFLPRSAQGIRPDHQYDIVYQSLMSSPLPLRGSTERKLHGELVTKLEAIGTPVPKFDATGAEREVRADELQLFQCLEGGNIDVSAPEYDLLQRHVTATVDAEVFPKVWSRQGQQTLDWLASVKSVQAVTES